MALSELVVNMMQKGKTPNIKKSSIPVKGGIGEVESSCDKMLDMITVLQQYVSDVLVSSSLLTVMLLQFYFY